jgi:dienelactone hydrolase
LWTPKSPLPGKPAILLCHGWGGLRAFLDVRYASKFVDEGFTCMTFDYRGWGTSDGMLIPVYDKTDDNSIESNQNAARLQDSTEQTPVIAKNSKFRIIRHTVDVDQQLTDIDSAISFLSGEDVGKIGIFGSSVAGGHVLTYGARDPTLVSCIVSQVPSIGRHGAGDIQNLDNTTKAHRQRMAREGWIPAGAREIHLPAMDGSPILRKLQWYDPLIYCSEISVPTLIIDVEKEELWDVNKNGKAAFDRIPCKSKEYYVLKGYNHYDAYKGGADEARKVTMSFFQKHLTIKSKI